MSDDDFVNALNRWRAIFGPLKKRPPPAEEPTVDQLSAIQKLLDAGQAPYTDFAVFGPFGDRLENTQAVRGLQIFR